MANEQNIYTVEAYFPFIIKTVSEVTNRYVEVENSIELSIAMEKFYLANETYDDSKGSFLTYAKTLMRNAVIDYLRKQKSEDFLTHEDEMQLIDHSSSVHDQVALKLYEEELEPFHITFDKLIDHAPVHAVTRRNLIDLGKKLAEDPLVVQHLYEKKRLPISVIAKRYDVSEKVIKSHKLFLIAILVAFEKQVDIVIDWIT